MWDSTKCGFFFHQFQSRIRERYKKLYQPGAEVDEWSKSIPDGYSTIAMLDRFSNGDILKHDEILQKNYIYTLDIMLYWTLRDEIMEQERKKRQPKLRK